MATETKTLPGRTTEIGLENPKSGMIPELSLAFDTLMADFRKISHLLSNKELRRPRTAYPTGAELRRMAKKNPPPPEWYEGEEERPF
ncbi:MAG: hypothetical protein WD648_14545 [Planctomycetaceae bacterium]